MVELTTAMASLVTMSLIINGVRAAPDIVGENRDKTRELRIKLDRDRI